MESSEAKRALPVTMKTAFGGGLASTIDDDCVHVSRNAFPTTSQRGLAMKH